MPYLVIAETEARQGPLFALWQRGPSGGVTVMPWASLERRDMQALARSLGDIESEDHPSELTSDVVLAGALRHADGRTLALIDLDDAERKALAETIAREIEEADARPSGLLSKVDAQVFVLVGQHLVSIT